MLFERILALIALVILSPILILLLILGYFDTGQPVFKQKRVGQGKENFTLYKFRTMEVGTSSIGTHDVDPNQITKFGHFLRRTKLDELPQLWNVVKGDMRIVGPRPNLPNQSEVIKERELLNVYSVKPGITGLSQINEIDMSSPKILAETDAKMISEFNFKNRAKLFALTLYGKGQGDRVG